MSWHLCILKLYFPLHWWGFTWNPPTPRGGRLDPHDIPGLKTHQHAPVFPSGFRRAALVAYPLFSSQTRNRVAVNAGHRRPGKLTVMLVSNAKSNTYNGFQMCTICNDKLDVAGCSKFDAMNLSDRSHLQLQEGSGMRKILVHTPSSQDAKTRPLKSDEPNKSYCRTSRLQPKTPNHDFASLRSQETGTVMLKLAESAIRSVTYMSCHWRRNADAGVAGHDAREGWKVPESIAGDAKRFCEIFKNSSYNNHMCIFLPMLL